MDALREKGTGKGNHCLRTGGKNCRQGIQKPAVQIRHLGHTRCGLNLPGRVSQKTDFHWDFSSFGIIYLDEEGTIYSIETSKNMSYCD
jgi:hypothetical protein